MGLWIWRLASPFNYKIELTYLFFVHIEYMGKTISSLSPYHAELLRKNNNVK